MLMFAVILVYVVLTTRGKLKIRLLDNWPAEKKDEIMGCTATEDCA